MSVAVNIISTIIKSAVNSKVGNELANELIGISVDDVSEKGISKINDFINSRRTKIEKILSKEKMKSMDISEDNIAYVIAEVKELFSEIEITDEIFRQCRYDSINLCSFLWKKYAEDKTRYLGYESDIKKSLLAISEALIKLLRESEEFVKDISIQISNTVEDSRVEIQRISDYLEENFSKISADNQKIFDILREILEQNQKSKKENNITQEEKFQNNKKDEYLKIWNSRLFLHIDNDERPITLADAFIMPDYDFRMQVGRIKFRESDMIGDVINKFVKYDATSSMLITGAPGIGKTTITAWIANEYKDNENVIILRFRDWESEELNNGLLKSICGTIKCKKKELENKILILDGFDEIKDMDNRDCLLNSLFNDILDYNNLKIIVTSRPNYIDSYRFQNFFELLPFGIKKVSEFYEKIKGVELDKNKIDCDNLNVVGVPVILYMAIMSDIDLTQKTSKPELYSRIFAEDGGIFDKFCYEGIAYDKGNQILRDRVNAYKYLKFLGKVAFTMFEKNDLQLNKGEYVIPELSFRGTSIQIMEFPIKYIFDNTESTIEFIHKSLYEYFVAEYFYALMYNAIVKNIFKEKYVDNLNDSGFKEKFSGILGESLKKNILSPEILEFLKFKIKNSQLDEQFDIVNKTFRLMLQDGMTYYSDEKYKNVLDCEMNVFKNMLEILHIWGFLDIWFGNSIIKYIKYNNIFHLNLRGMYLSKVKLSRVNLSGSDLEKVNLSWANLSDGKLVLAELSEANLYGTNLREANLRGAKLIKTDLRQASLEIADLSNTRLRGADLEGAGLEGANLRGADLEGVDLRRADLRGADLEGANLRGADLEGADLEGADLRGADLEGANLMYTKFDEEQISYLMASK